MRTSGKLDESGSKVPLLRPHSKRQNSSMAEQEMTLRQLTPRSSEVLISSTYISRLSSSDFLTAFSSVQDPEWIRIVLLIFSKGAIMEGTGMNGNP